MKKVLLKDIVIPAGTVLTKAPIRTELSDEHGEALVSLSKGCCAFFTVYIPDVPKDMIADLVPKTCELA